ncbi:MAG TPA: sialidase family protein [Anaerolineae bacterium]|nr:sialidase family protein [Anaerolineae bacterium]HNU05535.1 sialidase family protein [Anaerolineae bacterium]
MNREATGSCAIRVFVGLACLASVAFAVRAEPIRAQVGGLLPLCPHETYGRLFVSPNYINDGTIFWLTAWRFAGANHEVVLRSMDRGESWLQVFDFPYTVNGALFTAFDIAPEPESTGLVAYLGLISSSWINGQYHFYRTTDGGDTWERRTAPCNENLQCYDYTLRAANRPGVLFQPRFRTEYYPSLPAGVARSVNGGATWQQVWSETAAGSVVVSSNYDQDETVFASLTAVSPSLNTRLIISHDGGETWSAGGQGLCSERYFEQMVVSPGFARDQTLLNGSLNSSLFMSQDGGLTWRAIFPPGGPYCGNSGVGDMYPQFSPNFPEDPTIYAATSNGLYASYDAGGSWTMLAPNTSYDLIVRRATETNAPTLRASSQGPPDLPEDVYQVFLPLAVVQGSGPPHKPHTLFMGAHFSTPNDAAHYRSDDGGRTWQCINIPLVRPQVYLPLLRIRS